MSTEYKVKFGDVWSMGKHRLLCGDSTEKAMLNEFLTNNAPKLCLTDPPYGVNYSSRSTSWDLYKLKIKNDHVVSWGDAFKLSQSPVLYVWFSYKYYDITARAVQDAGYDIKQMVVWVKSHFSLQRHFYHLKHEQCLVCVKKGVKVSEHWKGDRKQVSVWNVPNVRLKQRIHPTEKPIGVYTIAMKNHTQKGDIVLDLFAGSGANLEAAHSIGRIGYGVELCSEACNKILARMENLGNKVSLESNIFNPPLRSST